MYCLYSYRQIRVLMVLERLIHIVEAGGVARVIGHDEAIIGQVSQPGIQGLLVISIQFPTSSPLAQESQHSCGVGHDVVPAGVK